MSQKCSTNFLGQLYHFNSEAEMLAWQLAQANPRSREVKIAKILAESLSATEAITDTKDSAPEVKDVPQDEKKDNAVTLPENLDELMNESKEFLIGLSVELGIDNSGSKQEIVDRIKVFKSLPA